MKIVEAIVMAFVASFVFTPIGGIAIGIAYYWIKKDN